MRAISPITTKYQNLYEVLHIRCSSWDSRPPLPPSLPILNLNNLFFFFSPQCSIWICHEQNFHLAWMKIFKSHLRSMRKTLYLQGSVRGGAGSVLLAKSSLVWVLTECSRAMWSFFLYLEIYLTAKQNIFLKAIKCVMQSSVTIAVASLAGLPSRPVDQTFVVRQGAWLPGFSECLSIQRKILTTGEAESPSLFPHKNTF